MNRGAIFDRDLTPEMLDVALRIRRTPGTHVERLRMLEIALRMFTPEQEATRKTRAVLSHVWLNPPTCAVEMIGWAVEHGPAAGDSRALHLGAMLATYPFFGEVCAVVGRQLALGHSVATKDVRQRLHQTWGQRISIDVGVRRCVHTLHHFGVVDSMSRRGIATRGDQISTPPDLFGWIAHALLLTRGASSVDERDLTTAPELFMFDLRPNDVSDYPLLERVNEGSGRRMLVSPESSGGIQSSFRF